MKRTLYVDLDYTLGHLNAVTDTWCVYSGAQEALEELRERVPMVLLTANIRPKVAKLFATFPKMRDCFTNVITSEDFASHFLEISKQHVEWVRSGKVRDDTPFLKFVHLLWSSEPALTLPKDARPLAIPPLSYEEWEQQVYFPHIAPNKAIICGKDGLLVDDEFANPKPNPIYADMIRDGRAFFAGPRGGTTSDTGPHWEEIKKSIFKRLAE